jgi:hypothetical protein
MLTDRTDFFGLPTWAAILIVIVVMVGLCDIVNNVTKIWRKHDYEAGTAATARELFRKVEDNGR